METYQVTGMTCQHCVQAVKEVVEALPHVDSAEIDLKTGTLRIKGSPDKTALKAAIEEEGYQLI